MKQFAFLIFTLLWTGHAFAAGFRLEFAHCDWAGGPLTVEPQGKTPLPDGCLVQVLPCEDMVLASSSGTSKRFDVRRVAGELGRFHLNGQSRLRAAGYFLADPGFASEKMPSTSLFLRVWNAADTVTASGYWDSPPYAVLPGFQQVSFRHAEWTYHARRRPLEPLAELASETSSLRAARYETLAASPNPFNSTARISFSVAESGTVRLRVFDLHGRVASVLVDGPLAAGQHDVLFDGGAFPTGLYFLSLEQAHAAPRVQKLILLR